MMSAYELSQEAEECAAGIRRLQKESVLDEVSLDEHMEWLHEVCVAFSHGNWNQKEQQQLEWIKEFKDEIYSWWWELPAINNNERLTCQQEAAPSTTLKAENRQQEVVIKKRQNSARKKQRKVANKKLREAAVKKQQAEAAAEAEKAAIKKKQKEVATAIERLHEHDPLLKSLMERGFKLRDKLKHQMKRDYPDLNFFKKTLEAFEDVLRGFEEELFWIPERADLSPNQRREAEDWFNQLDDFWSEADDWRQLQTRRSFMKAVLISPAAESKASTNSLESNGESTQLQEEECVEEYKSANPMVSRLQEIGGGESELAPTVAPQFHAEENLIKHSTVNVLSEKHEENSASEAACLSSFENQAESAEADIAVECCIEASTYSPAVIQVSEHEEQNPSSKLNNFEVHHEADLHLQSLEEAAELRFSSRRNSAELFSSTVDEVVAMVTTQDNERSSTSEARHLHSTSQTSKTRDCAACSSIQNTLCSPEPNMLTYKEDEVIKDTCQIEVSPSQREVCSPSQAAEVGDGDTTCFSTSFSSHSSKPNLLCSPNLKQINLKFVGDQQIEFALDIANELQLKFNCDAEFDSVPCEVIGGGILCLNSFTGAVFDFDFGLKHGSCLPCHRGIFNQPHVLTGGGIGDQLPQHFYANSVTAHQRAALVPYIWRSGLLKQQLVRSGSTFECNLKRDCSCNNYLISGVDFLRKGECCDLRSLISWIILFHRSRIKFFISQRWIDWEDFDPG